MHKKWERKICEEEGREDGGRLQEEYEEREEEKSFELGQKEEGQEEKEEVETMLLQRNNKLVNIIISRIGIGRSPFHVLYFMYSYL